MGYHRAGFDVTGVDIEPKVGRHFPFEFIEADALGWFRWYGSDFDAVHASPPCPRYSSATPADNREHHPDLLDATRALLTDSGLPYVIENVPGAPMVNPVMLCGAAFGLGARCRDGKWRNLRRHRLFESNVWLMSPGCACGSAEAIGVYGDGGGGPSTRPSGGGGYKAFPEEARAALGMEWGNRRGITNAIPPAYTEFIGEQLLTHLRGVAA